jgi:MIP family channel proteins
MNRFIAESIGTFFLVLIGPGAAIVNAWTTGVVTHVGVSLAFAFVVFAMVVALGRISGAHINPAVTVALWSVRRFPARDLATYVVAQCLGSIAAAAVWRVALGSFVKSGATLPTISVAGSFGIEFLLTFALMFVILAVVTDERLVHGVGALAIGLTVGFCALVGGPLTGASMNPARSFGPAAISGQWQAHWLYWLAPLLGAVAAAHVFEFLHRSKSTPAANSSSQDLAA